MLSVLWPLSFMATEQDTGALGFRTALRRITER